MIGTSVPEGELWKDKYSKGEREGRNENTANGRDTDEEKEKKIGDGAFRNRNPSHGH
jgi:hypothetical protein